MAFQVNKGSYFSVIPRNLEQSENTCKFKADK